MAGTFLDREKELTYLAGELKKEGSFIVLYGGRRIGKTALIGRLIDSLGGVYLYVNSEKSSMELLNEFSSAIRKQEATAAFYPASWDSFLEGIFNLGTSRRLILYFDEFQRFSKVSPQLIANIQKYVDTRLKSTKISILVSGSSIGMMKRLFFDRGNPLFGRATASLHLKEFDFGAVTKITRGGMKEKIKLYSVFGGLPQFYGMMRDNRINTMEGFIDNVLVKENSTLLTQPRDFLMEEFGRASPTYFSILYAIASGRHTRGEISSLLDIKQTSVQPYLYALMDVLNMVRYEKPIDIKADRPQKRGRYVLNSNYLAFWFNFAHKNADQLELGNYDGLREAAKSSAEAIVPYRFEDISRYVINKLSQEGKLPRFTRIGKWWGRNPNKGQALDEEEIDIVALNYETKAALFADCKWTNRQAGIDIYDNLRRKVETMQWHGKLKKISYVLFSKAGFTEGMKERAKKEDVMLFDLAAIEEATG